MVITIQFWPQWTESSERRSSACSVDRNGSKPAVTDNDDHCSVFFHEDLFGRNNSRLAKSFCSTGPWAGWHQETRRDTKGRGGEPNH